jgi:hypothetical protein
MARLACPEVLQERLLRHSIVLLALYERDRPLLARQTGSMYLPFRWEDRSWPEKNDCSQGNSKALQSLVIVLRYIEAA